MQIFTYIFLCKLLDIIWIAIANYQLCVSHKCIHKCRKKCRQRLFLMVVLHACLSLRIFLTLGLWVPRFICISVSLFFFLYLRFHGYNETISILLCTLRFVTFYLIFKNKAHEQENCWSVTEVHFNNWYCLQQFHKTIEKTRTNQTKNRLNQSKDDVRKSVQGFKTTNAPSYWGRFVLMPQLVQFVSVPSSYRVL